MLAPGVLIIDDGRCVCWDGGVDGGSCEDLSGRAVLTAGEREGELARYKSKSAPACFEVPFLRFLCGGGVRGGEDEIKLLEAAWLKECTGRSVSSSSEALCISKIGECSEVDSGIGAESATKGRWAKREVSW